MYLGVIAEVGSAEEIFRDPRHPYTEALLAANPSMHEDDARIRLQGSVPDPSSPPAGCRFHTRCPVAFDACGWDVSDVLRVLEVRGRAVEGLRGVERRTPFEGTLGFEAENEAASAVAELTGDRAPAPMRAAAEAIEARGRDVYVRFPAIEEMSVHAVGQGHHTACILHADDDDADHVGPTSH
jgi:oligopeptide/dipeptide ABC transporter ATP-binding protein